MPTQYQLTDNPNQLGIAYVAGCMSAVGPPTWNYPRFAAMATRLRAAGWDVISPHELHSPDESDDHDWFMRRDVAELIKCGRIVMLGGWEISRGANIEYNLAKGLGMEVWYEDEINAMSYSELAAHARVAHA